jgi:hypothetical protein
MKFMHFDIFYAVLEEISDQTSIDTRVICATHINHNDLGIIWISIDSK